MTITKDLKAKLARARCDYLVVAAYGFKDYRNEWESDGDGLMNYFLRDNNTIRFSLVPINENNNTRPKHYDLIKNIRFDLDVDEQTIGLIDRSGQIISRTIPLSTYYEMKEFSQFMRTGFGVSYFAARVVNNVIVRDKS